MPKNETQKTQTFFKTYCKKHAKSFLENSLKSFEKLHQIPQKPKKPKHFQKILWHNYYITVTKLWQNSLKSFEKWVFLRGWHIFCCKFHLHKYLYDGATKQLFETLWEMWDSPVKSFFESFEKVNARCVQNFKIFYKKTEFLIICA